MAKAKRRPVFERVTIVGMMSKECSITCAPLLLPMSVNCDMDPSYFYIGCFVTIELYYHLLDLKMYGIYYLNVDESE